MKAEIFKDRTSPEVTKKRLPSPWNGGGVRRVSTLSQFRFAPQSGLLNSRETSGG